MSTRLRIHWALPVDAKSNGKEAQADHSGQVDLDKLVRFVRQADESPIESLLTPFGFHMPDPFPLLGMLSQVSHRVKYLLAYRPGLMSPTLFVQQVNTLSQILTERLMLNIVAGFSPEEQKYYGDHLTHDERFERSLEFLEIANLLWNHDYPLNHQGKHYHLEGARLNTQFAGGRPRIYLSGNSKIARSQAAEQADGWLRYGDTVEALATVIQGLPARRKFTVGLRMSIVSGKTRSQALERAGKVIANPDEDWKKFLRDFVSRSDSQAVKNTFSLADRSTNDWIGPHLWTGAVPYRGGPALAIVGSYDDVAQELLRYHRIGVDEFILSGWPTEDELDRFTHEIYPRIYA